MQGKQFTYKNTLKTKFIFPNIYLPVNKVYSVYDFSFKYLSNLKSDWITQIHHDLKRIFAVRFNVSKKQKKLFDNRGIIKPANTRTIFLEHIMANSHLNTDFTNLYLINNSNLTRFSMYKNELLIKTV